MPRPPRIHYPGATYHVMARGVDGREIYIDDEDRRNFLDVVQRLKGELPFSLLAYCLMNDHFHFALRVENAPLARIMHRLLTTYVLGFNTRHERQGHLFQARYKALLCLDDPYLISLIPYIHMNPVRAGLVSGPAEWIWSSYDQYSNRIGTFVDTSLFLAATDAGAPDSRTHRNWPAESFPDFDPWPRAELSSALLRSEGQLREPIDTIAASLFPQDWNELRSGSRRHEVTRRKAVLAKRAISSGHSLVSVATWLNCSAPAVHHLLRRTS